MKTLIIVLAAAVLCGWTCPGRAFAINDHPILGSPDYSTLGPGFEHPAVTTVRAINAVPNLDVSVDARLIDSPSPAVGVQLQMPQGEAPAHEAVIARLKSEVPGFADGIPGEAYMDDLGTTVHRNFWLYSSKAAQAPRREPAPLRGIRTAKDELFRVRARIVDTINNGIWLSGGWSIWGHRVTFDGVAAREIRGVSTDGRLTGRGIQLSAGSAGGLEKAEDKLRRFAYDPLSSFEEGETFSETTGAGTVLKRNYWLTRP